MGWGIIISLSIASSTARKFSAISIRGVGLGLVGDGEMLEFCDCENYEDGKMGTIPIQL